jgi:hypothetical protein
MGETIIRKDAEMARAILAQFLMLGLKEVGTQALAVTLLDAFYMAVEAYLEVITDLFNIYAVPYLFQWYIDPAMTGMPKLAHSNPRTLDLKAVAAYISSLARHELLTGDLATENFLRSLVPGMPPSDAEGLGVAVGGEETDDRSKDVPPAEDEEDAKPPPDDEEMSYTWVKVPKGSGEVASYVLGDNKLPADERLAAYNAAADQNRVTQRQSMEQWEADLERELTIFGVDVEMDQLRQRMLELVMYGLLLFREQSILDIAAAFWLGFGSQSGDKEQLRVLGNEMDLADAWIGYGPGGSLVEFNPDGNPTLFGDIRGTLEGKLMAILLLLKGGKKDEAMLEISDAVRVSTRAFSRFEQYSGHVWRAAWAGANQFHGDWAGPVRWIMDLFAKHCATCPLFDGEYPSWMAMMMRTGGVLPGHGTECDGWCRCHIEIFKAENGLWEIM